MAVARRLKLCSICASSANWRQVAVRLTAPASTNPALEIEHDLLLILMDRIIADANRIADIRSLVEDGIKKSHEVLGRLEQGRLSLEFCRKYLEKFLKTGTLTRTDLLDFYQGGDLKAKYHSVHEDIKALVNGGEANG